MALFALVDAGALPEVLKGERIEEFSGPYEVQTYVFFAEISSVSSREVKIHHYVKIELAKLLLADFSTDWFVYQTNDLSE